MQMSLEEEKMRQQTQDTPMTDASTTQPPAAPATDASISPEDVSAALQNTEFLSDILTSLPGVDVTDARVQGVIKKMQEDKKEEKKEDKKEDKKDDDQMQQ